MKATDYAAEFKQKLVQRTAVVGVVGLGYVGLPLALRFAEAGFKTLGFDIDPDKIAQLAAGTSYIEHIHAVRVASAVAEHLVPTVDFSRAAQADALILCVPTPLGRHLEPDLGFVIRTIESLLPYLRAGQLVSLESTTYPGTTEEELRARIESRGLRAGVDVFVVYSPEREDPGNTKFSTQSIPKVCGGCTPACLQAGVALYGAVVDTVVPASSTRAAEMAKLLENIHRAVNIGLVNELKIVADAMALDIHEVIDLAATKPFGFVPYRPGPGLGGHCIPIDPYYLTWKAREYGVNTRFIELAGEVNRGMPHWVIEKLVQALNDHGKAIRGAKVLVLGIAYKKNVGDVRESPAAEIMLLLEALGAKLSYSDPHVPVFPKMREYAFKLHSEPLTAASLAAADAVLLVTDHDRFDYALVREHARLLVDTRGRYREAEGTVVRA